MRPSFSILVDCDTGRLMESILRQLEVDAEEVEGNLTARLGVLRVPLGQRRFWTPSLELAIDKAVDGTVDDSSHTEGEASTSQSRLWGTFSPRPEVWTAFVFSIGVLVIISVFSSVYGIAQLAMGQTPNALIVPAICIALAGGLYLAALIGQGLSLSEMYRLRAFVDDCLRRAESNIPDG
jgi:hypothetical protein